MLVLLTAVLFYDNLFVSIILTPYVYIYYRKSFAKSIETKRWRLNLDFSETITCMSGILESGYSVENAVALTYRDMLLSYDADKQIMKELKILESQLQNNIRIEDAFLALGERTGIDDIKSFSDVFATAKRTGGNIIAIIRSTSATIHTRMEVKREIRTLITAKKYESDLMRAIPFVMLLYLRLCSPSMIESLYGNTKGAVFMTGVLIVYLVLSIVADRITRIEV